MIPRAKWIWQGSPGHFIAAESCVFHLCTIVGPWIVSTVGEYHPRGRGVEALGKPETIGFNRLYETMVFRAARCADPGCDAFHQESGTNEDFAPANTRAEATAAHMAMCTKWARRKR